MLFKQFRVRNSFTNDDSKGKGFKRECDVLRDEENNGMDVMSKHKEEEASLITDLKGLKRFEEGLGKRDEPESIKTDRKKFISDFFGDDGINEKKLYVKR